MKQGLGLNSALIQMSASGGGVVNFLLFGICSEQGCDDDKLVFVYLWVDDLNDMQLTKRGII